MKLRSHLFAYVMENARIDVDPEDWFADHFEHAGQNEPQKLLQVTSNRSSF